MIEILNSKGNSLGCFPSIDAAIEAIEEMLQGAADIHPPSHIVNGDVITFSVSDGDRNYYAMVRYMCTTCKEPFYSQEGYPANTCPECLKAWAGS